MPSALNAAATASRPRAPQLTLEDVARDAFRRAFFLDAFEGEREALEQSFLFLERVREYKQLLGRREALQHLAEEIVGVYLRDPPPHLCIYVRSPSTTLLLQRIITAVDSKCSIPDLFSSMEKQVSDRLEKEKFVAFLQTPQHTQLCDALRKHRELPLGEILVDARRTSYLEHFLQQTHDSAIGNLIFWVEVQTVFLPLIQTKVVSVALFEEIQATVRRLYNEYLTESSSTMATVVPEVMRKDILKGILQLQGEPFSPLRYATLFRHAQEKIWHWLQTMIWPKFQASMYYVALVVETENLESDRQLRKLSEHVQATASSSPSLPPKASAIFIPVCTSPQQRSPSVARYIRVIAPLHNEDIPRVWRKELRLPSTLKQAHIRGIQVVKPYCKATEELIKFEYSLHVTLGDNEGSDYNMIDCLDFIWNWRHCISIPAVMSPSHRPHYVVPKPRVHNFSLPMPSEREVMHGYVMTVWPQNTSESTKDESIEHSEDTECQLPSTKQQSLVPHLVVLLASHPLGGRLVSYVLERFADFSVDEIDQDTVNNAFSSLTEERHPAANFLRPQYSGFYLNQRLHHTDIPVQRVLRELSHKTVTALLAALLVGKSLVIVCPRPAMLVLVANTLVELLRPFEWQHLFLPLCPVRTACALADRSFFTPVASSSSSRGDGFQQCPFIIGIEAELGFLKMKEVGSEPRHRIRNSIYSSQRVSLQLKRPPLNHSHAVSWQDSNASAYPREILHTQAIVLDVDADDIYTPERVDIPEFPQGLVRSLELSLKDAVNGGRLECEDSRLFTVSPAPPPFIRMVLQPTEHDVLGLCGVIDYVRLAVLGFMESLVGDVVYYFCSVRKHFANDATGYDRSGDVLNLQDWYLVFEADQFLDSKIEVGCREFYRQVFQTEAFRQFLLRQHHRFCIDTQS